MTPTARTLAALRKQGYTAAVVERWIPHINRHVDLFGVIDILAYKADVPGVMAIQATTGSNAAARTQKAKQEPKMVAWLTAGMGRQFQVWAWRKAGERGKRKKWRASVAALYDGTLTGLLPERATASAPSP